MILRSSTITVKTYFLEIKSWKTLEMWFREAYSGAYNSQSVILVAKQKMRMLIKMRRTTEARFMKFQWGVKDFQVFH